MPGNTSLSFQSLLSPSPSILHWTTSLKSFYPFSSKSQVLKLQVDFSWFLQVFAFFPLESLTADKILSASDPYRKESEVFCPTSPCP